MKLTVIHVSGSRAGAREQFEGALLTVGRDPQNLLRFDALADDKVSAFHAKLEEQPDGALLLTDLGSRNGTFLNGHRITAPIRVPPGAVVTFGEKGPNVSLQFEAPAATAGGPRAGAPAPASAPPPGLKATAPVPAPAASLPRPGAGPAPAAVASSAKPAAGGSPAPGAAKPAGGGKPLLRWGCLGSVGLFLAAVVVSLVLLGVSARARSMVPSQVQIYLRRIPGVGKLFSPPPTPTLPGGVRVPTRLPGGGKKPAAAPGEETPGAPEGAGESGEATEKQ